MLAAISEVQKKTIDLLVLPKEECALLSHLIHKAQRGYSYTQTLIKAFAWAIVVRGENKDCFGKDGPSKQWWTVFGAHHPKVT